MDTTRLLSNHCVSELEVARRWYSTLFGRGPDATPMDGLLEWHLSATSGLQVWLEPERAGGAGSVITVTDLDAAGTRLAAAGIENVGPEQATSTRILRLADPDGNRVVLTD